MQVNSSINQAIRQNQLGKPFFAYSLYSWGLAAVVVIIGQLLDYYRPDHVIRPGFGEDGFNKCWFSSKIDHPFVKYELFFPIIPLHVELGDNYKAMYAYVYGPVFATILVDIVFFVVTTFLLHKAGIGSSGRHDKEKYR